MGLRMSGVAVGQPIDGRCKRMSEAQVRFSGSAGGEIGQGWY